MSNVQFHFTTRPKIKEIGNKLPDPNFGVVIQAYLHKVANVRYNLKWKINKQKKNRDLWTLII